jgi:acyl-CoA synthetase (AMP-forming)/AMP-acid ligase II
VTTLAWHDDELLDDDLRALLMGPGAMFELVDADVEGAVIATFAQAPRNVGALLDQAAAQFGDRPYLVFPEETVTFGHLPARLAPIAAVLTRDYGLQRGDRLAVAAANSLAYALVELAALTLGIVVAGLNGWWTGPELAYGIQLSRPAVLMSDAPRLARITDAGVDVGVPTVLLDDVLAVAGAPTSDQGATAPSLERADVAPDDPALILFTSGTTGRPKGATLSHRNIVHFGLANALSRAVLAMRSERPSPTAGVPATLCGAPFFHISGTAAILMTGPRFGATIVFPPPGRWDPGTHLELTERHRVTTWSGVPTQYWRILDHPRFPETDLTSLMTVGSGGAPFPPELSRLIKERIHDVDVSNGYGATETTGAATISSGLHARAHPDSVGTPTATLEIQVRADDGTPLGEGEVGEICVRGACVFLGYWDDPGATTRALYPDRWYRTGDYGHVLDGALYVESRREDLILRGGENIYPIEIEHRIVEHPAVADAAVVGVDDRELGQVVKAYVVVRDGAALTPAEVQQWVGEALAAFKVPAEVEFRPALPYTETGKVMKHAL